MSIKKLKIYNFRSLLLKEYYFTNQVNIFYGKNGVGKTSILESIYYLSTGKSFRKSSYKALINFKNDNLTIYLKTHNNEFSVSKNKQGKWKGKLNNTIIHKQSHITNLFPVVSIDPEVYRLVDSGPIFRRNFLDWLVFHVEHDYLLLWKKTHKCIKQLNILYKNKASNNEISLWEKNFLEFSEELTKIRKNFFDQIQPSIIRLSQYMQKEIVDLNICFKKGWSDKTSLAEQLRKDREKNLLYGKLQNGPHKMDITIKTSALPASQTLSRGQKKILSISFYMAYIELLNINNVSPVICIDDFDAELDEEKLEKAASFFTSSKSQLFITSVQKEKINRIFINADMFHVEQ